MDTRERHSFVICAYKESAFLEECILSLKRQTKKTNILMITSTPNQYIEKMAQKYDIPLYINIGEKGITQDWNFAYQKADTKYITIAHQDDVYEERYVEKMFEYMGKADSPLIFFTDYYEIRDGKKVKENKLLRIKRLMLAPLKCRLFWKSKFIRRRILALGSPICCPSVTYVKDNLMNPVFLNHFRTNEDWETWERISKLKGSFVYCDLPLTYHRIHKDSETSAAIAETGRGKEDYEMYRKFWPSFIAKILVKLYGTSEKSNDI